MFWDDSNDEIIDDIGLYLMDSRQVEAVSKKMKPN